MVAQKSMDFGPSAKRLIRRMAPQRLRIIGLFVLGVASVAFMVVAPKILGHATDLIFNGIFGNQFGEKGVTKEQAIEGLRAAGKGKVADMLSGMDVIPGGGVAF